jgi:sigma-E factor negative regulatory protein RseC
MLETQARVTAVEPGYAWIESERRSGCSHCSNSGSCGVSALGKLFGVQRLHLRLPDTLGVQAGDDVIVGLSERRLVAAAAVAYMLPLLIMIVIALAGGQLGQDQGVLALLSFIGLVIGLWLARYQARRTMVSHGYLPVMLKKQVAGACNLKIETESKGVHHE